jgi:hypothetical protein
METPEGKPIQGWGAGTLLYFCQSLVRVAPGGVISRLPYQLCPESTFREGNAGAGDGKPNSSSPEVVREKDSVGEQTAWATLHSGVTSTWGARGPGKGGCYQVKHSRSDLWIRETLCVLTRMTCSSMSFSFYPCVHFPVASLILSYITF